MTGTWSTTIPKGTGSAVVILAVLLPILPSASGSVEGDHEISPYVTKIDGDINSVKGLPMALVKTMLSIMINKNE